MPQNSATIRYTPNMEVESHFRLTIRNALDLDLFVRDYQIIEEIQRLKKIEAGVSPLKTK